MVEQVGLSCDLAARSKKGPAGDWTGSEGTEVLKLNTEPPKIRIFLTDTETINSQTDGLKQEEDRRC